MSVLLPNLLLLIFLPALVVWVIALVDVARGPDIAPDTRIIYALLLVFASPLGVFAWLGSRGRLYTRTIVTAVSVMVMALLLVITGLEIAAAVH